MPALVACSGKRFDECFRLLLATLPKRNSDDLSGELLIRAYAVKLGGFSQGQIEYLTDRALECCEWFPTIAQCLAIISEWQRADAPLRLQNHAKSMVLWERQARFDAAMSRIASGDADQAEIDALPETWLEVAETRGLLHRQEGGGYSYRPAPEAPMAALPDHRPRITCYQCQDVGRILTLEGEEANCPGCAPDQGGAP